MIKTYNRTMFNPDLTQAKFTVYTTVAPKYTEEAQLEEENKEEFTGVQSWSIVEGGDEALDIEMNTCEYTPIDEQHEYLILNFADGTKKTYCNSHAVMFVF